MSVERILRFFLPSLALVLGGLFFQAAGGSFKQPVASLGNGFLRVVTQVDGWMVGKGSPPVQADAGQAYAVPVATSGGLPTPMIMGYYYDPGNSLQAMADLKHYGNLLTGIVPFWYTIYADGSVVGQSDPKTLAFAAARHLYVFALVQNMAGGPVFHRLLNDPAATKRAIGQLLQLVQANGYSGVNLDFEGIRPSDRAAFTAFVRDLGNTLHLHGYYLTLSIPAKTQHDPGNSWSGAYDYRALGTYSDLIMLMAYDQHSQYSAPGPIASKQWVESVVAYAVTQIPPSKIILGVPAYGYSWAPGGSAKALSYGQASNLAQTYGANPSKGYLQYYQDGVWHQVWYENAQTFLQKVGVVADYNLRGIVLWRLGIEDPNIWQTF